MDLRLAAAKDLPNLRAMYISLVADMKSRNIDIWDEIYPAEFLGGDIDCGRLYILEDNGEIAAAFALCDSNEGERAVEWEGCKAIYIDRFAVSKDFLRRGVGMLTLGKAIEQAKAMGAKSARLFVVDTNIPAIGLYKKFGFRRAAGVYDEVIDDSLVLHEFGFEIKI